jgi:hypothetical protein
MDLLEKFTAAMRSLAEERDLELVVEHTYASSGYFSLQRPESFDPVLRFPFDFRTGYSSFAEGIGEPGPLGLRPDNAPYSFVRGGEHDGVLARVAVLLDEADRSQPPGLELAGASR